MTPAEAKVLMDKFVCIKANGSHYPQEIHGWVRDYDRKNICVVDTDKQPHIYELSHIVSVKEVEFSAEAKQD